MLENMSKPVRLNRKCKVAKIADGLSVNDRELFWGYVNDDSWLAEHLSAALRDRGVQVSPNVLRLHRRSGCACQVIKDA